MDAWNLLFTSDIGLMSLAVILFIILMAGYFVKMVKDNAEEERRKLGK